MTHQDGIDNYHRKEKLRIKCHTLKKLGKKIRVQDYSYPENIELHDIYYISYGRNAWHGTWGSYFLPNDFSFLPKDLRQRAESRRVQGSQFEIDVCSSTILIYKTKAVALAFVGSGSSMAMENSLFYIKSSDLTNFWKAYLRGDLDGLYAFRFRELRKELLTKDAPKRFLASPQGTGKSLNWSKEEPAKLYEDQAIWFDELRTKMAM